MKNFLCFYGGLIITFSNFSDQAPTKKERTAVYVRLTKEERDKLTEDAKRAGLTAPRLLKKRYFRTDPLVFLMNDDSARRVLAALSKIGTNINQIAHQMNSGFREGWSSSILSLADDLHFIRQFVAAQNGHC